MLINAKTNWIDKMIFEDNQTANCLCFPTIQPATTNQVSQNEISHISTHESALTCVHLAAMN